MPSKAVVDAVAARIGNPWIPGSNPPASGNGITVYQINENPLPPPDGSVYLETQFPTASETITSIGGVGNRLFREIGTIRFILNVPIDQGIELGLDWADQLRTLFRRQTFGGVDSHDADPAVPVPASGNYFVLAVSIPYQRDLIA